MKNRLIVGFLLISSLVVTLFAQECPYEQALELFGQGNFAAAIPNFDAVLNNPQACPEAQPADVHYWRAWCHYRQGNQQQALDDFARATASLDNGLTARYMRIKIGKSQHPGDIKFLEQSLQELNALLAQPGIQTILKDRALLYRNLVRLELGELLYKRNSLPESMVYFQGIQTDNNPTSDQEVSNLNALVRANALAWLVHVTLSRGDSASAQLKADITKIKLPRSASETPQLRELKTYYQSLASLLAFLLSNDYAHFNAAKNELLTLDAGAGRLLSYHATISLLEKEYTDVINAPMPGDPYGAFLQGWAFLLRHQERNDLSQAEQKFKAARDALAQCKSALRAAAAFRFMQARHLRDFQANDFAAAELATYFSRECLSDPFYVEQQKAWTAVFEEGYGYRDGDCQTGRAYLELGLYKSNPQLVEKAKTHLRNANCDLIRDDLYRAILLCIGQTPDYEQAIEILTRLLTGNPTSKDEVKYALAMAYYNDNQAQNAIPLFDDLARRGSLDACYKIAHTFYEQGQKQSACEYINAIQRRSNSFTIYRNDANKLYSDCGCGAFGDVAINLPAVSDVRLDNPEYQVFAYDYIGEGVGIISKYFYEMKSELIKFITPLAQLDFYNLALLDPTAAPAAYIRLAVTTPLSATPQLRVSVNNEALPGVVLQKNSNSSYSYESGPLDPGVCKIVVSQKGSFGWSFENFISGTFQRDVSLDSAFVLQRENSGLARSAESTTFSYTLQTKDGVAAFSPFIVAWRGQQYSLPPETGIISGAVAFGDTFYCLIADRNQVKKVALGMNDTCQDTMFISGAFDAGKDMADYKDGLRKPQKMVYDSRTARFYILNSDGRVFEFNRRGDCIGVINKPAAALFFADIASDAQENCLWLLDVTAGLIHKYDLANRSFNRFEQKRIEPGIRPLALLIDNNYFYLADIDGNVHLHKKHNFQKLQVFSLGNNDGGSGYVNFSLAGEGLNHKKILFLAKQANPAKIRPDDLVEVYESRFDPGYELTE